MGRDQRATARDVMKMIREQEIRFLDLKFVDLLGTLQHLTVPTEVVDEDTFRTGFAFDGSSVKGFQKISESDMLLMPDPASVFRDPFFDDPALSVFCDIADPIRRTPYSRDPRGIAGRAERLARSLGVADQVFFGPEIEFFVFDEVRFDQATQHGYYFLNSAAAFWSSGGQEGAPSLGHQAGRKQAYFAAPPIDQYNNLRSKISNVLQQVGLQTELHHHEVAAAGQCEIGFRFGTLLLQADAAIKYKYTVKNVVDRYKKTARLGNAHEREPVEGRAEPVLQGGRLRGPESVRPPVHRWTLEARAGSVCHLRSDDEFLSPPGAWIRGANEPDLLRPEPERLRKGPRRRVEPEGKTNRVQDAGSILQPVSGVLGPSDGGYGRCAERHRPSGSGG
jgi:hypothetical protein